MGKNVFGDKTTIEGASLLLNRAALQACGTLLEAYSGAIEDYKGKIKMGGFTPSDLTIFILNTNDPFGFNLSTQFDTKKVVAKPNPMEPYKFREAKGYGLKAAIGATIKQKYPEAAEKILSADCLTVVVISFGVAYVAAA